MSGDPAGPPGGSLPAVLAVDGGNSKTDLVLVAGDGTPVAAVRGPGMTGRESLAETVGLLASLIGQAQGQGGLAGRPVARHLSACVANADLPEEEEELAAALGAQGWTATTEVVNDTFAVLRAGLSGVPDGAPGAGAGGEPGPPERYWGVAVTCGAGINCVGLAPDGRTARFLALGWFTGDWGGGEGLGRAAQWWAIRAEDGRGPQTALRTAVAAHFGLPTMHDVGVGIHQGEIGRHRMRELAPVVLATAGTGDPVAVALVRRQANEVCAMAVSAMRRLGLDELPAPVVLGGGLLTTRDPLLISSITERIAAQAPRAAVRVTDVPPVVGAALLGLDHLGCGPAGERRLRAAYTA